MISIVLGALGTLSKELKIIGGTGDHGKNQNYSDHSIVNIFENAWNSQGVFSRLAVC